MPESGPMALADHVLGSGTPLLLLHGGTGSHRHWERVVAPLSRHFEVHAPDLPGYGVSPDVPTDIDGESYVALAASALEALAPGRRIDLVGFSFGGSLAAAVARRWVDKVRRLTLLGPGGFGVPHGRQLDKRRTRDTDGGAASRREVARHNLASMMFRDPASVDESVLDQQMWNITHTRFNSLKVSFRDHLVHDVAALACPVQVIWGAHDVMAHPSVQARAGRIHAARADVPIHLVADAGHWVQYERPDDVIRLILAFHAPAERASTEPR